MRTIGLILAIGGVVVVIEAFKHFGAQTVSASSAISGVSTSPTQAGADQSLNAAEHAQNNPTSTAPSNPGNGDPYSPSNGVLTPEQLTEGLYRAGLPQDAIANMVAILLAENGGRVSGASGAGASGFAQLTQGFEGITDSLRLGTNATALRAQYDAVVRGYMHRGYQPWDPWSYVGGGDPNVNYGEVYVGPGNGSYRQYVGRAQQAYHAVFG